MINTPAIIFHIILAITFFYLLNWIGRHTVSLGYVQLSIFVKSDEAPAYNFILRTLSPTVYILLISTILYSLEFDYLVNDIWLVVPYYFIFRVVYNLILGRSKLINWQMQVIQWIVAIPLSYITYNKIISTKQNLFPDLNTMGNELWLIIILFLYATFNNIRTSEEGTRKRKLRYLKSVYRKYHESFSEIIKSKELTNNLEILVYSIMIYEAFGRPKIFRIMEDIFPSKAKTLGIMQVEADKRISDEESIEIAIDKINKDYVIAKEKSSNEFKESLAKFNPGGVDDLIEYYALRDTIARYNRDDDYISEVMDLYGQLKKIHY